MKLVKIVWKTLKITKIEDKDLRKEREWLE